MKKIRTILVVFLAMLMLSATPLAAASAANSKSLTNTDGRLEVNIWIQGHFGDNIINGYRKWNTSAYYDGLNPYSLNEVSLTSVIAKSGTWRVTNWNRWSAYDNGSGGGLLVYAYNYAAAYAKVYSTSSVQSVATKKI